MQTGWHSKSPYRHSTCPSLPLSDAHFSLTKPTASWHHNRTRVKIKDRVRHYYYQVWQLGDGHDSRQWGLSGDGSFER